MGQSFHHNQICYHPQTGTDYCKREVALQHLRLMFTNNILQVHLSSPVRVTPKRGLPNYSRDRKYTSPGPSVEQSVQLNAHDITNSLLWIRLKGVSWRQ